MSNLRRTFALTAFVLVSCSKSSTPGAGPAPARSRLDAAKAAAGQIREADLLKDVSYLGSDENRGRRTPNPTAPSSPGYDSAATYIARFLKAQGVKPMGDNGTYFQHYVVTRSTLDTTKVSGSIGGQSLKWGTDFAVQGFLIPGVREAEVVYISNGGLRRAKRGIDPYAGFEIKGKWLLVNAPTVVAAGRGGRGAGGAAGGGGGRGGATADTMGRVGIDYTTYMDEARHQGALGILLISTAATVPAASRTVVTGQDLNPSLGFAYAQYQIPRVLISADALKRLLAGTKLSADEVLAADASKRYPASANLGKRLSINFAATTQDVRPYNVVGFIEGSDPKVKDEWISLAAHLDGAVRTADGMNGNDPYNAADDNASGSAGNMGVVRALMAGPRPRRSILLVWDSGEEVGLWGTRFVAYGPWSKNLWLHVSNDMIGRSRPANDTSRNTMTSAHDEIYITGPKLLSSNTEANLQLAMKEFPFIRENRVYEDVASQFYYPRTDAGPYLEQGIPILQFFNGTEPDYHQSSDEVSKLDIPKMVAVSKLSYGALWLAADAQVGPKWDGILPYSLWWVKPQHP